MIIPNLFTSFSYRHHLASLRGCWFKMVQTCPWMLPVWIASLNHVGCSNLHCHCLMPSFRALKPPTAFFPSNSSSVFGPCLFPHCIPLTPCPSSPHPKPLWSRGRHSDLAEASAPSWTQNCGPVPVMTNLWEQLGMFGLSKLDSIASKKAI